MKHSDPILSRRWRLLVGLLLVLPGILHAQAQTEVAAEPQLTTRWGEEPVERKSATRSTIVLNGVWRFMPARGEAMEQPIEGDWGLIRVPGPWRQIEKRDATVAETQPGRGEHWPEQVAKAANLQRAWYERALAVPADWSGRQVMLRFAQIGTEATVWIDGQPAGQVSFPGGEVDITSFVRPGQTAALRVLVTANPATATGEGTDDYAREDAAAMAQHAAQPPRVNTPGLVDDVTLEVRPIGPRLDHVIIQTSTRKRTLAIHTPAPAAGTWTLSAQAVDDGGRILHSFPATTLAAGAGSLLTAQWGWQDPPLWSPQTPNLLTLVVRLVGADGTIHDELPQTFGFREFWIEGRDFFLNGHKLRLRPAMLGTPFHSGVPQVQAQYIDWYQSLGNNFIEIWPNEPHSRGETQYHAAWARTASRKGMLINGVTPHMRPYIRYAERHHGGTLRDDDIAAYRRATERGMIDLINEPSVVLWGTSGNYFSASTGFLPQNVGMLDEAVAPHLDSIRPKLQQGRRLMDQIRQADPTRPVFAHNGALGDFDSVNTYLNLIPLQEREEWLSHWAMQGKYPSMFVEFGEPLDLTYYRGRVGYTRSAETEPLVTEHLAAYLGEDSYHAERGYYRDQIMRRFKGDQKYAKMLGHTSYTLADNFQDMTSLFIRNTRQSWRTWGFSGGMVSWDLYGWATEPMPQKEMQPLQAVAYVPGQRGIYHSDPRQMTAGIATRKLTRIGQTYQRFNAPTLAWIAGSEGKAGEAFTDKTHNYAAGTTVRKQIVLINDTEATAPYSMQWSATLGKQRIGGGPISGSIAAGEIEFVPIEFSLPTDVDAAERDGKIILEGTFDQAAQSDSFAFRVFGPSKPKQSGTARVFDPTGQTTQLLKELGVEAQPWTPGQALPAGPLVIGREALSEMDHLPEGVEAFVEGGGICLVMAQQPDWMREKLGMRVSRFMSRRVFPIVAEHPVLAGLDAEDLRDWAGHSTLLEPHPDWRQRSAETWGPNYPYIGGRWGGRGAVTSAAIETPHFGGWTPLLACEFDLAFSPLIEKSVGRGLLILCMLDLEDHATSDPAARRLATQLLDYARSVQPPEPMPTLAIGLGDRRGLVQQMGLQFTDAKQLPDEPALAVVGPAADVDAAALDRFIDRGGRALILARRETDSGGVKVAAVEKFALPRRPPDWPEARGLGLSDLRLRTNETMWLVSSTPGWEAAADGLLARKTRGDGVAIVAQIDPASLDADRKTYLRLSRWRQTRAIGQLLGNLGARFETDTKWFAPRAGDLYHPDYRTDYELGDDPFRFYKW